MTPNSYRRMRVRHASILRRVPLAYRDLVRDLLTWRDYDNWATRLLFPIRSPALWLRVRRLHCLMRQGRTEIEA